MIVAKEISVNQANGIGLRVPIDWFLKHFLTCKKGIHDVKLLKTTTKIDTIVTNI